MKKIIITAIFINCYGTILYAQSSQLGFLSALQGSSDATGTINRNKMIDAKGEKESSISGSPFLDDKFTTSSTPNFPDKFTARYNIYSDIIEVNIQNKIYTIPKNDQFKELTIGNTKLKLIKDKYYIELYKQNNFSLLKVENIKFTKAKSANNTFDFDSPAKYTLQKPIYFIYKENEEITEINKKAFKDNLDINKFIENAHINLNSETDLKKLIQHIAQ
ncbi:hypothetical protein ATE49_08150 [Elizabethkingia miricola]|uniref:Uncharacterized protein n=2 Tax=Elizabethkingia miricola TaxID=172045 RepID=A0ABD5B5U2_ELIMR|nr:MULTISPECIES: hypothetical protein [Elizabethkingia]MDQ8749031.1 hypothetical protein [Elizabethkingia miricola]OBS11615.1 hypothetical protein ATE49_08150 [Elizabethkingia miricola]OPB91803.1 hypothetical protein BAS06_00880 [Elizabethkingia miricola]PSL88380.1 hypothetical protein C7V10_11150 [Elizabethkingia miricola]QHQ86779.1 hypothetical protein FE632_08360 [Elizabethkingia miricola]